MGEDNCNTYVYSTKDSYPEYIICKKMVDNPIQKWVRDLNRHFLKEDIQRLKNMKMDSTICNLGNPN